MTKRFSSGRSSRTALFAVPIIMLMAVGTFADAAAQTLGQASPDKVRNIPVFCPKEKSKSVTLEYDEEEALFKISPGCLCTTGPAAAAKERVGVALNELYDHANGIVRPSLGYVPATPRFAVEEIRSGGLSTEKLQRFLSQRALLKRPYGILLTPPPGGRKVSATVYCYDAGEVFARARELVTGEK